MREGDIKWQAITRLEESIERIIASVRGAAYGQRIAGKRIGDLTGKGGPLVSAAKKSAEEMKKIVAALKHTEENLTENSLLALDAHFRVYLKTVTGLELYRLPDNPRKLEERLNSNGIFAKAPEYFGLFLFLANVSLDGGTITRDHLESSERKGLEIVHTTGKTIFYMAGDRVALTEAQLDQMGRAIMVAAKKVKMLRVVKS